MTAINIFRVPDYVHLCTDGMHHGGEPAIAPKSHSAPHMPLVLAVRGLSRATNDFAAMIHEYFATFDDIVAGIAIAFPEMLERYLQSIPPDHCTDCELIMAGWSQERDQAEAYLIRGGEDDPNWYPPYRRIWLDGVVAIPPPAMHPCFDGGIEDYLVALMASQKRDFPLHIGAYCQCETVTAAGIAQRILAKWPKDEMLERAA